MTPLGFTARYPSAIPKIKQHLCPGGETLLGEVESLWAAFPNKSASFLQHVDSFNQSMRVSQVSHIVAKRIGQSLGGADLARKIRRLNVCVRVGFELSMYAAPRAVSVRIGTRPPIHLDCGMQWLGAICHIMPQPSSIEDDDLLDRSGRFMGSSALAVLTECQLEAAVYLCDGIRL